MKRMLLFAVLSWSAYGQTAKVAALSPEDTERAMQLRHARDKAAEAVTAFDKLMRDKYVSDLKDERKDICSPGAYLITTTQGLTLCGLSTGCKEPTKEELEKAKADRDSYEARCYRTVKVPHPREGWENGINYSEDFRYIVPVPTPEYHSGPTCCALGGIYASPAISGITQ